MRRLARHAGPYVLALGARAQEERVESDADEHRDRARLEQWHVAQASHELAVAVVDATDARLLDRCVLAREHWDHAACGGRVEPRGIPRCEAAWHAQVRVVLHLAVRTGEHHGYPRLAFHRRDL